MPSLEHNGLVDMFRENPSLAPHFLRTLFQVEVPPYAVAGVAESSLDQLVPVEFRADLVLELRDESGALLLSIVLEVQLQDDDDKKFAWPVYTTVERSRKRCPALVLVVAPDARVARWAAESIDLGLGLSSVTPLVLGPAVLPRVTDDAAALCEPELAILSALAHGNAPDGMAVVLPALGALARLDPEHEAVYFHLIHDALREPMRAALEKLIMEQQAEAKATFPPFAQHLIDRGRREGVLEGVREGKLEGVREGKLEGVREGKLEGKREGVLEGKRGTLLRLMVRQGIALTDEDRARIEACTDTATLDRWVDNVIGARTAADVLS